MRILFLGEGSLSGPARYLAAILISARIPFDHRPDRAAIPASWQNRAYDAVILSDYRYASWTRSGERWLARSVQTGTGLMMIGGWASFTGIVGGYEGTKVEHLLPVRCKRGDDRVHRPAVMQVPHRGTVIVNGYHVARAKPGAHTMLEFQDLNFRKGKPILGLRHPALVTGTFGQGRTAAFLTDCAPHWAGGLVDWGIRRIRVRVPGGGTVEVGDRYLSFFRHWIHWLCRR